MEIFYQGEIFRQALNEIVKALELDIVFVKFFCFMLLFYQVAR